MAGVEVRYEPKHTWDQQQAFKPFRLLKKPLRWAEAKASQGGKVLYGIVQGENPAKASKPVDPAVIAEVVKEFGDDWNNSPLLSVDHSPTFDVLYRIYDKHPNSFVRTFGNITTLLNSLIWVSGRSANSLLGGTTIAFDSSKADIMKQLAIARYYDKKSKSPTLRAILAVDNLAPTWGVGIISPVSAIDAVRGSREALRRLSASGMSTEELRAANRELEVKLAFDLVGGKIITWPFFSPLAYLYKYLIKKIEKFDVNDRSFFFRKKNFKKLLHEGQASSFPELIDYSTGKVIEEKVDLKDTFQAFVEKVKEDPKLAAINKPAIVLSPIATEMIDKIAAQASTDKDLVFSLRGLKVATEQGDRFVGAFVSPMMDFVQNSEQENVSAPDAQLEEQNAKKLAMSMNLDGFLAEQLDDPDLTAGEMLGIGIARPSDEEGGYPSSADYKLVRGYSNRPDQNNFYMLSITKNLDGGITCTANGFYKNANGEMIYGRIPVVAGEEFNAFGESVVEPEQPDVAPAA